MSYRFISNYKKDYIVLLCYLVFAFYSKPIFSQTGTPYLSNYSPHEYLGHPQVWSIVQDKLGLMYFGNLPGVLQYDGVNWNMIPVLNGSIARSLAVHRDGKIYVGCQSDLGFIEPDNKGKLEFISLMDSIPIQYRDFKDVWRTYATSQGIYFQTNKYLFRWNDKKMKVWKPKTSYQLSYKVLDWIYITEKDIGLKQIIRDTLYMVSEGEFFADKRVYVMLPYANADILIGTREHGLYIYDGIKPVKLESEINKFLIHNQLYAGARLSNGNYAIATIRGGGVIIDPQGNLKSVLNRSLGIRDDNVYSMFVDRQDGLWMGLGNGIARVEASSPIAIFNDASGLKGSVEYITRHNGKLHVATHQGVYILNENIDIENKDKGDARFFDPVQGIKTQCWALASVDNLPGIRPMLLVATSDGIFQIDGYHSKKLTDDISLYIYQSQIDPKRIFIGLLDGLGTLYYENDKWTYGGNIGQINKIIHMIKESDDRKLWLATKYQGAYRMDFSKGFDSNASYEHFDTTNGLPKGRLNLFHASGDVIFATPKGLFRYDDDDGFVSDSTYGTIFADGSRNVYWLHEDQKGNIWMNTGEENGVAFRKRNGTYRWESKQFRRIPKAAIWAIFAEEDKKTWLGGPDGLICYDRKVHKNYNKHFSTLLREVKLGRDSVIFAGTYFREQEEKKYKTETFYFDESSEEFNIEWTLESEKVVSLNQTELFKPTLKAENNSVTFKYSAPSYDNEKANQYQYYLEGYEKKWSNWSLATSKEYTNLHENSYRFHVRAKDIYGYVSKATVYEFRVLAPWYRTAWAYIGYIIVFVLLVWAVVQLSIFRLRAAKKKLQTIIIDRTAEVVKQKDELEKVNVELQKLSLVASETDNPVIITDAKGVVEYVNDRFTKISGFTLEDLNERFGKTIFEISMNDMIRKIFDKSISEKKSNKYETINLKKDGGQLWMSSTLTPIIGKDGKVKKVVIIDTDITERKKQEEIIQQKNRDITDSITYAKKIQEALLPLERNIKAKLPESFILYKPKDIVSGDFYWFAEVQNGTDMKGSNAYSSLILAACDCTGHGVPGAFMSMIGNDLLNQIVLGQHVTNPTEVLDALHKGIRFVLRHDEGEMETRDGMDLSFCLIDVKKKQIEYAGAHRPLYLIKNGDEEVTIIKGDKIGIGDDAVLKDRSFTTHIIDVNKGDTIYLFSDGYPDQIGGPRDKKYKSSRYRELLLSIQSLSIDEQKTALENEIIDWIGEKEQTDDILVIGVKF